MNVLIIINTMIFFENKIAGSKLKFPSIVSYYLTFVPNHLKSKQIADYNAYLLTCDRYFCASFFKKSCQYVLTGHEVHNKTEMVCLLYLDIYILKADQIRNWYIIFNIYEVPK